MYERWKELLVYEEDGKEYCFDCGWGVSPGHVYVAAPQDWDEVVPEWLCGRREEMVKMLKEKTPYVVEDSPPRRRKK